MKERYTSLDVEVLRFKPQDIIATSNTSNPNDSGSNGEQTTTFFGNGLF